MSLGRRCIINVNVSRETTTAVETWTCDWTESVTQALQFVGGYQGTGGGGGTPTWQPPAGFTELPGLKAESCDIAPLGNMDPDTGTYKEAKLTVTYGVLKPSEENSDPNQIYEAEITFGGEGFQINGKDNYTWSTGANSGQKLPDDVFVTKIIPNMEINCNFRYRPTLPSDTISQCTGKINTNTMTIATKTFAPFTVLFPGAGSKPGQSTDGYNGWSRELKFMVKNDGWNKLWSPQTATWESISPALYLDTDLRVLFSA